MADNDDNLVCDLAVLDQWLLANDMPGIDSDDLWANLSDLRQVAVRYLSDWSMTNRDQLSAEIFVSSFNDKYNFSIKSETGAAISEQQWHRDIYPLCFHTHMKRNNASSAVIGPFLDEPVVWHLHPWEFMRWMNGRVARHEEIMRSQNKSTGNTANIQIEAGYVVGFVNPMLPSPNSEVKYGDNLYEIRLNDLCDPVQLAATPPQQKTTRLSVVLLDAMEMINDKPQHGLKVVLSYAAAANAASEYGAQHDAGHAVDMRPNNVQGGGITAARWFDFYKTVTHVASYLNESAESMELRIGMLQDASPPTRPQVQATENSREWLRRLRTATATGQLTTADEAFPTLLNELGQMRLHLYLEARDMPCPAEELITIPIWPGESN